MYHGQKSGKGYRGCMHVTKPWQQHDKVTVFKDPIPEFLMAARMSNPQRRLGETRTQQHTHTHSYCEPRREYEEHEVAHQPGSELALLPTGESAGGRGERATVTAGACVTRGDLQLCPRSPRRSRTFMALLFGLSNSGSHEAMGPGRAENQSEEAEENGEKTGGQAWPPHAPRRTKTGQSYR